MKCCSRYTVGIIIGSIFMLASITVGIIISVAFILSENTKSSSVTPGVSIIMILFLTAALISGLLVLGIVKRRHNLLLPWMITYVIGICFSSLVFMYGFFGSLIFNAPTGELTLFVALSVVAIVIQIAIFYFICTLYRDIRKENINSHRPGSLQVSYQEQPPCYYTAVSNKS